MKPLINDGEQESAENIIISAESTKERRGKMMRLLTTQEPGGGTKHKINTTNGHTDCITVSIR